MLYILNFRKGVPHIDFVEKKINAQSQDQFNDPELFELLKTYQLHAHS